MQKRVRIGGGLVSDPNSIEARDTYFISLEKSVAGNSGRDPDVPLSLAGALTLARDLDSGTKGLYGTKFYILPTTSLQDAGAGYTLNKDNLSLEGVSVSGNGMSNPSLYIDQAGAILTISANMVEITGISLNAKAASVSMVKAGETHYKSYISKCRFYNYYAGGANATQTIFGGVRGIDLLGPTVLLSEIRNNIFIGCSEAAVYAGSMVNCVVAGNTVLGSGISGQSIVYGIYIAGANVSIDDNVVCAGDIGGGKQGDVGITLVDASGIVSNNVVAGFTTPVTATNDRNNTIA